MKKVIANKLYDTEKATLVATYHDNTCAERLYRKRTGEFFIHGRGSSDNDDYAVWKGNRVTGSEQIKPLTPKLAMAWAAKHLSRQQYDDIFGSGADDQKVTISLSLPVGAVKTLKNAAAEQGRTASALIAEMILLYLRD